MKKMILFVLTSMALTAQAYMPIHITSRTEYQSGYGCVFELANYDTSRYAIEWRYSEKSYDWMNTDVSSGKSLPAAAIDACSGSTCTLKAKHFQKNKPHYFAAREFIDENKNGLHDDGEFTREWSQPSQVYGSPDFINRCSFASY